MSLTVRAQLVVARYGLVIAVVFLLLSAVALGAAVSVVVNPPTEVTTEEVAVEEYAMETQTEAIVNGSNVTLYEPGQRLVDMPVYYYEETPELTYVVNVSVPEGEPVALEQVLTLQLVAARDDVRFFDREVVLGANRTRTTDGRATFRPTIDLIEVRRIVREERAGTRGVGSLQPRLALTVSYDGSRYSGRLNDSTPLTVGEEAFWPEEDIESSNTHSQTRTEEVVRPPDLTRSGLYGLVGLLLLALGAGFGWRYLQGFDVQRLRTELARSEFSEWISTGEIPTRADKEYVSVVSLEDLVDIGIDSNKRVIHDGSIQAYAVVDADVVYYFTHADEEIKDWLDV